MLVGKFYDTFLLKVAFNKYRKEREEKERREEKRITLHRNGMKYRRIAHIYLKVKIT